MLSRLLGLLFGVVDGLIRRLDPSDSAEAGEDANPVVDDDEQEDGHHEREEASRVLSRDALSDIQEELEDHLDCSLKPAWHRRDSTRDDDRNDYEQNNSRPCGDHCVRYCNVPNEGVIDLGEWFGDHRLGRELYVCYGGTEEAEAECVSDGASGNGYDERNNYD